MKAIIIIVPNLSANGMAIFPFILVKTKIFAANPTLINHEKIHLRQQGELLILPFYIAYLVHYLINIVRYRNHHQAYMSIVFEKEAYSKEGDFNYLKKRKNFAWIQFFGN